MCLITVRSLIILKRCKQNHVTVQNQYTTICTADTTSSHTERRDTALVRIMRITTYQCDFHYIILFSKETDNTYVPELCTFKIKN